MGKEFQMSDPEMIDVLIVDDHQIVRQGLRNFLELNSDIRVVGEAGDGISAQKAAAELQPQVILMDLVMPEMDGITATAEIKKTHPSIKIIALTSFTEDDKVIPAIQAGASGYLLKDVTPDDLVEAIRAAARGEVRLHPDVTRKLMEQVSKPAETRKDPFPKEITDREKEVIRLVANGRSNQEIADELFISEKTVKTHMSNILSKLELDDRTQLAIYAIKNGLLEKNK
jgi:two-component system, NarL family, response regulator LiaR